MSTPDKPIRLARPALTLEDQQALAAVLASGQLVQAGEVAAFEAALSKALGDAPVRAVSNGTEALRVALLALEPPAGAEIVLPAFTFPSVAHVVMLQGWTPVFVDIDPDDFGPCAQQVQAALSPRTAAVVWVHQFGCVPRDASAIRALEAAGVPVIEDAACSLGTPLEGRPSGTWARLGCLSFHPRKIITTGEGGAVTTRDPELLRRVEALRNHGQTPGQTGWLRFERPGLNARMGELNAALGRTQMAKLGYFLEKRRRLGRLYVDALAGVPGLDVPAAYAQWRTNFQTFVVRLDPALDRDGVIAALTARGVETTIGGYSIPHQPWAVAAFGPPGARYPHAQAAFEQGLALPLHPEMSDQDVSAVVRRLREVIG